MTFQDWNTSYKKVLNTKASLHHSRRGCEKRIHSYEIGWICSHEVTSQKGPAGGELILHPDAIKIYEKLSPSARSDINKGIDEAEQF